MWVPLQTFRIIANGEVTYPLQVLQKGASVECSNDDTCVDDPWIFIPPPDDTPTIFIRLEVRSCWGIFHAIQWEMWIVGGCA